MGRNSHELMETRHDKRCHVAPGQKVLVGQLEKSE